jgi:hypothetical protein
MCQVKNAACARSSVERVERFGSRLRLSRANTAVGAVGDADNRRRGPASRDPARRQPSMSCLAAVLVHGELRAVLFRRLHNAHGIRICRGHRFLHPDVFAGIRRRGSDLRMQWGGREISKGEPRAVEVVLKEISELSDDTQYLRSARPRLPIRNGAR